MFQISSELILSRSTQFVYDRGKEYHKQQRVKSISFIQEKLIFDANVLGTKQYNVQIQFDRNGELQHSSCACQAYENYWGICKHVIAVLLVIKNKQESGFFEGLKSKRVSKQIFNYFQGRQSLEKVPVDLEITYGFHKGSGNTGAYSSLSLRIGEGKLYVVKEIKKLFACIEKNEELEFGKGFTFDPSKHEFKDCYKPLINMLKELYEVEKISDKFSSGYGKSSIFKENHVLLAPSIVKRFFEMYKEMPFRAVIIDRLYEKMEVLVTDFPVAFLIKKEGSNLILEIECEDPLIPLTDEGEYFLCGDRIYKTSAKQQQNFKPFYIALLQQQDKIIRFYEEDKERFVSEVLPFAEKAGEVIIEENVQSLIEKIDLETEIYLDRLGETITADVKFIYGDKVINPFSPIVKTSFLEEKIFVREVEKERTIMDILGESEFKVLNNQVYLDEEDKVFDFVFSTVPKLQEYSQVYYSSNFKKTIIKEAAAFSGGIRLNEKTDMLEITFKFEGIERDELVNILYSLKDNKKYYRLKDGTFLHLGEKEIQEFADIVEYLGLDNEDVVKEYMEIPKSRAFYLDQYLKNSSLKYIERNHAFKEFVQNVYDPEDTDLILPEGLNAGLREYQKFGFKWLKTMSIYGLGAILADDMGLGKTLQVLTLLLSDKNQKGSCPSIIVVPSTLVYNWQAEVDKFAPGLDTVIIAGNKENRAALIDSIKEHDIVVTSYPLIRRDIELYKNKEFRYCILDEAQYIKNPNSHNAKTVKEIKAKNRIALTGTPMENSLDELWSLFDFILPGYLFSYHQFSERYIKPIIKDENRKILSELGRHIKPFILRRVKTEVLKELPEKIEHKLAAELTAEQKKIYYAYLYQVRKEIEKNIKEEGFEKSHIKILAALTRLRQLCCHPSLFLDNFEGESGKMLLLQELINDSVSGGHRILLFSQFTTMLRLIGKWLESKGIEHLYLDGTTKTEDRIKLVRAFNNGQGKIFLISLKAGGTGLNLTGADTVIHYDPWWNPAVEDQATDRAYRIGQKKSVHVMKLITRGTIEEKIYNLQENKKKLIDAVIQPGETMLSKMSEEEIRGLFID
ncbi:MAG: SNF2 helicase associated domain-containing protein [Clostridia bacterium]|nr:SNF2 helicase associated domain-containing protein [Clostridia bacterium]